MTTKDLKRYKTKPFDCWKLAKEIRMNHYREVAESRTERGKHLLVGGGTESLIGLPAGLGDYVFFGSEPGSSNCKTEPNWEDPEKLTLGFPYWLK